MVQPIKQITFLNQAQEPVLKYIGENIPGCKDIKYLDKIEIDTELDPHELSKAPAALQSEKSVVLKLNSEKAKEVFKALRELDGVKNKEGEAYVIDSKGKFLGFTEHEEAVQGTFKTVSDILDRAYNRRTNVSCWALYFTLKYYGFTNDDFSPIKSILTYDPQKPEQYTDFVKKYSHYLKLKESDDKEAEKYLNEEAFRDDPERQKKLGLVNLADSIINKSSKLSDGFLNNFPLIFAVQNLAMPVLARLVTGGFWGKLFNTIRLINPWVGDFLAEQVANFKAEIKAVKQGVEEIKNPFTDAVKRKETGDDSELIQEAEFTNLDKEEHSLKKVTQSVNEVLDRLFGRKTTLSSWIFSGLLWVFTKYKNYKELADDLINKNDVIKNFLSHIKATKSSVEANQKPPELSKEKFTDVNQRIVLKIFSSVISLANSLTPKFIKNSSNYFGFVFSVQNLFMPILSEFVNKGKIAGFIHFLRDVNPFLNDLLDYVANYRKEILDIQKENEKIKGLLPVLRKDQMFRAATSNLKTLWTSIREFGSRVFGKGVNVAT